MHFTLQIPEDYVRIFKPQRNNQHMVQTPGSKVHFFKYFLDCWSLRIKTEGGMFLLGVGWCYFITIRKRTVYGDWDIFEHFLVLSSPL